MVQKRTETKNAISISRLRGAAKKARAALAEKRAREAVEWKPREMPPGIPPRPENIVDYVVDYVQPNGETFKNYAQLAKALGTTRQNVFEWKDGDRIPDHFLPGIIMQTGINAAVLLLWNTANVGRPKSMRKK